jgi:hypothetical protein
MGYLGLGLDTQAQRETVVAIEHKRRFGFAQWMVWALVVEATLVIAGLLWLSLLTW